MRLLLATGMLVLAPSLVLAQAPAPRPNQDSNANSSVSDELKSLREALKQQQQQISTQQNEIEALRNQLGAGVRAVSAQPTDAAPRAVNAIYNTPEPAVAPAASPAVPAAPQDRKSPLSFKIGNADVTLGGFAEFSTVFRTTNLGSGVATSFGTLPYNNTVQGNLTETRLSAQTSQVSLKVQDRFGGADFTGYVEADFLGNSAANLHVSANSATNCLRQYWGDVRVGKWEFLGGQAFSWLTPNRVGLSPENNDIFTTNNVDPNYQVGLSWTRAPQFRVAYHASDSVAFGVAIENPQQFVGVGETIFPFAFNATLGPQFDANNNAGAPNLYPDIIPKVTYDTDADGRHIHLEIAGLLTTMKATNVPIGKTAFVKHTATSGGVSAAAGIDIVKNLRLVYSGFYSEGGGRYLFGLGPDVVVRPNAAGTDIGLSLVHSGSNILGAEAKLGDKTTLSAYFGMAYFQRNAFPDTTSPLVTKPIIGFGGINSPNSANRSIQETTVDLTRTFWKSDQFGSVQLMLQGSYVSRSPWFAPAGAPKNAHLAMAYANFRYTLP